ncbi:MAG: VCBS repeat-containing protein, partial [Planctomycetaceae bacterium]|nr:VCBS repeat-containing protein [Planctomycetaceae bacterium]
MDRDVSDRVTQLIEDYLDQSRHDFAPSLDELIENHPELANEIQRYLPLVAMFEHAAETQANSGVTSVELPLDLRKSFGRYQIESLLGQGGMGTVYLAHDTQLDRQVALKIPKIDRRDPAGIERFLREAKAMAAVHHPNLCPVHDVGEIDGQFFLTMAYIRGQTLADHLSAGVQMPPFVALEIVRKLAEAVQVAHDAGLVHRDLKPANVMIDQQQVPVIMDFGLAIRRQSDDETLTKLGMLIGSPAYMSPEQVKGETASIGPATDIYALGVMLYEMLCGRRPFQGSVPSVLGQIATQEPPPLRDLAGGIDGPLESLSLKAMAKNADDRFVSAKELAEAIVAYSQGIPNGIAIKGTNTGIPLPTRKSDRVVSSFLSSDTAFLPDSEAEGATPTQSRWSNRGWMVFSAVTVVLIYGLFWAVSNSRNPPRRNEITIPRNERDQTTDPNRANASSWLPPFPTPTKKSTGEFFLSPHTLGISTTRQVLLGDFDGDKDLDAFLINATLPDEIWFNNGQGSFRQNQVLPPGGNSSSAALGDIDADGDLDLVRADRLENSIWINDGSGWFTKSPAPIGMPGGVTSAIRLGDFDADGDLDAFVANIDATPEIWFNQGDGRYVPSGQDLGDPSPSYDVAIGDLDGDGDQDAWLANYHSLGDAKRKPWADEIWLNDGRGTFALSKRHLSKSHSYKVTLADSDLDGDLDAWVASGPIPENCLLWENNGKGDFIPHGLHRWSSFLGVDLAVGDLTGDGTLGVILAGGHSMSPFALWMNQEERSNPGQPIGWGCYTSVVLGDLDGDGDLDAVLADMGGKAPNQIWVNRNCDESPPTEPLFKPTGQDLDSTNLWSVRLGDFDGDKDLDACILSFREPARILINEGAGTFQDSG